MIGALMAIVALNSMASADTSIRCGGKYGAEELNFSKNPVNGVWAAHTKAETFSVYVDASRSQKLRVVTAEVVSDAEWEILRTLRDATPKEFQNLVSRLGSMKVLELWIGWTNDGFVHFEGSQREVKFSFSCTR